jgi:succinate-semialdehyde dehydrogenase/glutarate-semialdehyde dehydrogenase
MNNTERTLVSMNPATSEVIDRYPTMTDDKVDAILSESEDAYRSWRHEPIQGRAGKLRDLAEILRNRAQDYALAITREMGKPISESMAEIIKCADTCDYYAVHGEEFLAEAPSPSDSPKSSVCFAPLGIVLGIMPWNYPFWQVIRFAAPSLVAGNVAVLKHASNVTGCSLALQDAFHDAGFPPGTFRSLIVAGSAVERVIADSRVSAVSLTGSDTVGRRVGAIAGEHLKKSVLELGGSDAFVVLDDADVESAARTAVKARFQNCGQSCIAAKRYIVEEAIADEFEDQVIALTRALKVGDPENLETELGPLARADLREELERQLRATASEGAVLRTGGGRPNRRGFFFEPTILTNCEPNMVACREETFGPLAVVIRVGNDEEALRVANETRYGLGGAIWSSNSDRAESMARRMETGGVFINGMTHSAPGIPFGGIKDSGYGRELSSFGVREFVNVKTLWR